MKFHFGIPKKFRLMCKKVLLQIIAANWDGKKTKSLRRANKSLIKYDDVGFCVPSFVVRSTRRDEWLQSVTNL